MLDEGHSVADVFLLLFKHFLFLRRVLRLLLALLRRLMRHGSLLCVAETAASRQYRPKSGVAQVLAGASAVTSDGAATKNIVNAEVLAALGKKGTLVKFARGSMADEGLLSTHCRRRAEPIADIETE